MSQCNLSSLSYLPKKDSRKALSFTYNRLNLTDEVKQGGVLKARYQYLTDGTKLSVRDGSGKNGYDYAGSFIYKVADGKREFDRAIVGDVQFTSQGIRYALTDQLGSIRALIDDKGKVVQQNDFYPFGAKAERDGLAQAEDNRFLFSGKECQALIDLNAYDFGARMYDASLGRWTAVDPLAEKYTNLSPYNYCINNPLVIVDPDGNGIWFTSDPYAIQIFLDNIRVNSNIEDNDWSGWNYTDDNKAKRILNREPPQQDATPSTVLDIPESIPLVSMLIRCLNWMSIICLLQSDTAPDHVLEATDSSKNEKHGDGGRALRKTEKQIEDIDTQISQAKNNKERKRLINKRKNIRENGKRKQKGEEHGRVHK